MDTSTTHTAFNRSLLAACIAFATPMAVAQDQQDEPTLETIEVVGELDRFGATKSALPLVETARSISIEIADQFIDKGALNLSQATTYLANVSGETFGYATRGDAVYSRGFAVPRYRDSVQELFGSYNTTRAELYTVEQVELLKGPASVLYGQGTPGGLLNTVSKTPTFSNDLEVVAEAGNFDRQVLATDGNLVIPGTNNQLAARFVGYWRDSDAQVDNVNDDTLILMPSISYSPSDATKITLIGQFQESDSVAAAQFIPVQGTLEPLPDGSFLDQDVFVGEPGFDRYDTESNQLTLLANHTFNDVVSLEITALNRRGEADYQQAWATFTGAGQSRYLNDIVGAPLFSPTEVPRSFFRSDNTSEQSAIETRLKLAFNTGPLEHNILIGAQYQDVQIEENRDFIAGGGALFNDFSFRLDLANPVYGNFPDDDYFNLVRDDISHTQIDQSVEDYGFYVSNEIALFNFRFNVALRYDNVENQVDNVVSSALGGVGFTAEDSITQEDDSVSGSIGVLYAFDSGVSPYINYSESFETVLPTSGNAQPLDPEFSEQIELGVKYEPVGYNALITAAIFQIDIENLENPDSLPFDAAQQQGESTISGAELEAKATLGDWYLQFAASVLDTEDPNGFRLPSVAEQQVSLWSVWRPTVYGLDGLKLGAGVRHFGETVSETDVVSYETPSYTLGDVLIGYEIENWDFALNVRNIEDKEYLTSCLTRGDCFPGVRRTAVLRVTYNL